MNNDLKSLNMIKQQLRTNEVLNPQILNLFQNIDRKDFLPNDLQNFAYSDLQIALPHQERMMTPLEEAQVLQSLELKGSELILEVGTGTGFLTALLAQLAKKVISIDYYPEFTHTARENLSKYPHENIELITGDASSGWPKTAPYDVIIFSSAQEKLRKTHLLQLKSTGKIFAIIGKAPVMQGKLFHYSSKDQCTEQILFETNLPPLISPDPKKSFVF